jgi:tetratricopeptide (TPR) repeat protein
MGNFLYGQQTGRIAPDIWAYRRLSAEVKGIMNKKKFLMLFASLSLTGGCATKTLTLVSNEKANISLVDYDDQAGEGDLVGETPVAIEVDKLKRQYIRVWGEGIHPQFWVVKPLEDSKTEITLRLDRKEDTGESDAALRLQELNRSFRMMMRAYKALTAKDLETAREISKQINQLQPDVAAPHIITGLSFLAEGNKSKARASFLKAKNLDPEDRDLEELLRLSNP